MYQALKERVLKANLKLPEYGSYIAAISDTLLPNNTSIGLR